MQWRKLGERNILDTPWFRLNLADVELPDGRHLDHYLTRHPATALALEETGWKVEQLHHLITLEPSNGFSDATHHIYWGENGEYTGPPVDDFESERIEWVPLKDVPDMAARGDVRSANAVAALLMLHRLRGL